MIYVLLFIRLNESEVHLVSQIYQKTFHNIDLLIELLQMTVDIFFLAATITKALFLQRNP